MGEINFSLLRIKPTTSKMGMITLHLLTEYHRVGEGT